MFNKLRKKIIEHCEKKLEQSMERRLNEEEENRDLLFEQSLNN